MRNPTQFAVLDLFAGAGGMALGFEAAGGRSIGATEIDEPSGETFRRMFRQDEPVLFVGPERGDMTRIPASKLLAALPCLPDIIIGGPPCQGFSRVGRAKQRSLIGEDEHIRHGVRDPARNELYRIFLDVVSKARPAAFVMENVPAMREVLGVDIAGRIAHEAAHLGYNVRYFLLNAAWYGVPQNRFRIFFVGLRTDLGPRAIPEPPVRTHRFGPDIPDGVRLPDDPWMLWGDQLPEIEDPPRAVSVRDAIGDLPRLVGHLRGEKPSGDPLPLRREPSVWAIELRGWPGREAPDLVSDNWYRFTPRDFRIFREMAHGDRYPQALQIAHRLFRAHVADARSKGRELRSDTKAYRETQREFIPPYRNDAFDDKWRKLIPGEPSWTLTAHLSRDSYSHIHHQSSQARTITVREAARLQSFPDSFSFCGNRGDQFRQIGNAVPPLMAKALAERLFHQLRELGVAREQQRAAASL